MRKYTDQQLKERFDKLPEALKDAMYSADIAETMFNLGKKFGLNIEKIGFMAEETGFIVLGLTSPREFPQFLADRLEVDAEKARAIALEISRNILSPLREDLRKAHQMEISHEEFQKAEVRSGIPTAPYAPKPAPPKPPVPQPPELKPVLPKAPGPEIDLRSLKKEPEIKEEIMPGVEFKTKIPPVDLRQPQKPPTQPGQSLQGKIEAPELPEKKAPYGGFDPYKEPIE